MTPFAAARVVALGLSRPACPIDERLLALLRREKAVAADASVEAIGQELGDMAGDEGRVELLAKLQYWSDHEGHAPHREVPGREPVPTSAEVESARGPRTTRATHTHGPGESPRPRAKRAKGQPPAGAAASGSGGHRGHPGHCGRGHRRMQRARHAPQAQASGS